MEILFVAVFLILLTLKLLKKIECSWGWVTAPLWAPLAVALIGGFLFGLAGGGA